MLKSVDILMRRYPLAADVEDNIVSFLGPARALSLSEACNFGSMQLLDWIWDSSCASAQDRKPEWSLSKYLRSDVHYYRWQFTKSLEVAAARGDLAVVKWLFEHFKGCEALAGVVEAAVKNGHLSVLQYLLLFKAGDGNPSDDVAGALSQGDNVVYWANDVVLIAAENGRTQVAKWLYEQKVNEVSDETRSIMFEQALIAGDIELVDLLLPTDGSTFVLGYDQLSPGPELIELMLDLGYFKWDEQVAGSAIRDLAGSGHLELMQQILQLHSPFREAIEFWLVYWGDALEKASASGQLEVVQWLIEHPLGQKRCRYLNASTYIDDLLCAAAEAGHIQVVRYLSEHGAGDKYGNAILRATRNGHTEVVKWILKHFCYSRQANLRLVAREAMAYGHVQLLQIFQEFDQTTAIHLWGRVGDVMNHAARRGHLAVLEWFHTNRTLIGSSTAMDKAAAHGHLEVVKWLHAVRSEKCSTRAMDDAASGGHLNVVKWLHSNRSEGCTASAMDRAAEHGHLKILQYLHEHRSEGCTNKAIEKAVSNGHVRVVFWLHTHYPDLYPNSVYLTKQTPNIFGMLLFLQQNYPRAISEAARLEITKTPRIRLALLEDDLQAEPIRQVVAEN